MAAPATTSGASGSADSADILGHTGRRGKRRPKTKRAQEGNAMLGLMQDWPLLCHRIIDHAAIQHPKRPVVTRSVEGPIHTTNYREVRARALKLAQRLDRAGIRLGD